MQIIRNDLRFSKVVMLTPENDIPNCNRYVEKSNVSIGEAHHGTTGA